VVLAYACRFPARVDRFVVASAPLRLDDAYQKAIAGQEERFAAAVPDGARRLAASQQASAQLGAGAGRPAFEQVMWRHFSRYVASLGPAETAFPQFRLLAGAERVTAPALVLAGELDVTTPPAQPRQTAATLPHAQYVELAGVGHFPEVEAPVLFQQTVSAFLSAT
jgi:pimeloyl-ACP methyl ester carboxylesterase